MMQFIDSHHHLWQYSATEYPWMGADALALKRDFLIKELEGIAKSQQITGFLTVQARQTIEETSWLLKLANQTQLIRGVVGWVPLQDPQQLEKSITLFSSNQMLKAVRHVVQDEADDRFVLRDDFNAGIARIASTGWIYDILIYAKHLKATIEFVDRHPNQTFVVDHIAKPTIIASQFDKQWESEIKELAKRENVWCKFSGVATEVRDATWSLEVIKPYWQTVLNAFGIHRLMYGSDWPVCLLKTDYGHWKSAVSSLCEELTISEQSAFWFENVVRCYRL